MAQDEEATLRRLHEYRKDFNEIVTRHGGSVFGVAGDSEMAVFADVGAAVRCALQIQEAVGRRNSVLPKASRMPIRVGVNFGPIIDEGSDVYGDAVNLTARLENFAEAGEVCVSGAVFDRVRGKLECGFDFFGKQRFKNIDRPVRVYRVRTDPQAVGQVISAKRRRHQPGRYWRFAAVVAFFALIGATVWGVHVQIEKQQTTAAAEKLIQQTRDSVGEAEDQIERLLDRLQQVSDRSADDGARIDALIALLHQAQAAAEDQQHLSQRRSAEIRRLLELLEASESRASAERARADELLQAMVEAEQSTAPHNVGERDESLSRSAIEAARDQTLRETLLHSWREAELQASLSQSRADQLLASVNNLASFAVIDGGTAADDTMLPIETDTPMSLERERAKALLASLEEAQSMATDKREEAEGLHARLLEAEDTLSDNGTALLTLREWTVRIEGLLATLKTLEARIADDVANAERTLQALTDAEATTRSQIVPSSGPLPADRAGASYLIRQQYVEKVLASIVRTVHELRVRQASQLEAPTSQTKLSPAPGIGLDRFGLFGISQEFAHTSETTLPPHIVSPSRIDILPALNRSDPLQKLTGNGAVGTYDGEWLLRIQLPGHVGARLETPVVIKRNAFGINTLVNGWNVILDGSISENSEKLIAEGRIWNHSAYVKQRLRIDSNLVNGAFTNEGLLDHNNWRSHDTIQITLLPIAPEEIAALAQGPNTASQPEQDTEQQWPLDPVSGSYDGPWVVRFATYDHRKSPFEAVLDIKDNRFNLVTVANGYSVYLNGKIDVGTKQLLATAQVRQLFGSGAGSGSRKIGGIFKIDSTYNNGQFSGKASNNKNARMELPNFLQYTFMPSIETSPHIATFGASGSLDSELQLSKVSDSASYDGPWVVRLVLVGRDNTEQPLETEVDVRNNAFVTNAIVEGWNVYVSGRIDEESGKWTGTGQVRDRYRYQYVMRNFGIFNIDADLIDGGFSGQTRMNMGTWTSVPEHIKYILTRKPVPEQLSASQ